MLHRHRGMACPARKQCGLGRHALVRMTHVPPHVAARDAADCLL